MTYISYIYEVSVLYRIPSFEHFSTSKECMLNGNYIQRSSEKRCGDPNGFIGDMSAPWNIGPHREAAWSSGPFMASWISTHIFLPLINPRSCLHALQNGFRKQLGLIALKRSSMWPWNMSIFLSTTSFWTRRELIGAMVPEVWPIAIWCHM